MVMLNAEIKEAFSKVKLFPVATASKAGVPNVALIAFVMMTADDTFWLADNFMNKTLANVKENPNIAFSVYDPDSKKCFQIKGTVKVTTSGPDFEKMRGMVHAKKPDLPAKSLLVMKVTEVFSCSPGPTAGKKVL
ncbi:MAG: pyridoxamine 5'-phosphate oxidase family protein [Methanoregulaceae archaeon]|nr:pyridoxamine 5'-phosphate oxidase family protein [Methanoregulaceae archaeon]